MIDLETGIEVHVCEYCNYAIRDEIPTTTDDPTGWSTPWRLVTLDDGPHVHTWHRECADEAAATWRAWLAHQPFTRCTICGEPMPQELADYGEHRHGHCMS